MAFPTKEKCHKRLSYEEWKSILAPSWRMTLKELEETEYLKFKSSFQQSSTLENSPGVAWQFFCGEVSNRSGDLVVFKYKEILVK